VVIPFDTGRPHHFSEGLAGDSSGNPKKWGFFDRTGKLVVPYKWDKVRYHQNGRAMVRNEGKWGIIDRAGKLVSELRWEDCGDFHEGIARVKEGGKWGFVNREGSLVIACIWDEAKDFSGGLAFVKQGERWGIIDSTGQVRGGYRWARIGSFTRGFAAVSVRAVASRDYNASRLGWQFVDTDGKVAISSTDKIRCLYNPPRFSDLGPTAILDNRSFADRNGNIISTNDYRLRLPTAGQNSSYLIDPVIQEGLYLSRSATGNGDYLSSVPTEIITADGEPLLSVEAASAANLDAATIPARSRAKRGLMDTAGNILVEPVWDDVRIISTDRVLFRSGGKWGLADRSGKVIFEPSWDEVGGNYFYYWTSTSAIVKNGGKFGLVYTNSGFVIDPVADKRIRPWRQRIIREGGKFGLRDLDIGVVVEAKMDTVPELWRGLPFEEAGKFGMIDRSGKVALEPVWDRAEKLSKHWYRLEVKNADGETSMVVDRDGRATLPESLPGAHYVDFYGDRRVVLKSETTPGGATWSIYEPATSTVVTFPEARSVYWNGSCAQHDLIWIQQKSDQSWQLYSASKAEALGHSLPSKPEKWVISNGQGKVQDGEDWYYINPIGERVEGEEPSPPPHFSKEPIPAELAERFDRVAWVAPGVAAAWGDESGLVNGSGEWVFRGTDEVVIPRFREFDKKKTAERFQQGLVVIESPTKWGFARINR
ncbi:MAG: WG repeat-containing protein, partial [Verrucomicrobiales bacterium]